LSAAKRINPDEQVATTTSFARVSPSYGPRAVAESVLEPEIGVPCAPKGETAMGFRFRRTLRIVPGVRLNLSRSGPSVSLGPRGLHYTLGTKGTRVTAGIPGSGMSWTKYQSYSSRSRTRSDHSVRPHIPPIGVLPDKTESRPLDDQNVKSFESSPIDELVAGFTSELAPLLNAARRQFRFNWIVGMFFGALILFEIPINLTSAIIPTAAFGFLVWLAVASFDRHRLTISLDYSLQDDQTGAFERLANAFHTLMKSRRVWRIPVQFAETDWKRHAGASTTSERNPISLRVGTPKLIKSNLAFLCLPLGKHRTMSV
jgi:Protein of unknown function (DUF4236)